MRRFNQHLLLLLAFGFCFSCNQSEDRRKAQDEFRQRQKEIQKEAQQEQPAPPTAQTAEPAAPEETPIRKPTTTAGDKVIAVKDGDTIDLLRNGQTIKVRLFGVDCPEKAQAFGQKAKQFTSDLIFGKNVQLIAHNTDRYGRTVGTIILPDGRSLNEELVREGYAWHYKAYSNDTKLANLEADARRFKRGLWQDVNPTPPWEFRKEKRTGTAGKTVANLPKGADKREVYICNSTGSGVYHFSKNCSVLKRCKEETLTITEAVAIRDYGRRADRTCSAQ
ncbi:thermonuclease family protein [Pontibacter vulgaris]|uniref:thermonuclease family protein n=1 Tax=Pontibacter vulgaris TaxID=2905679 RepID=UPI001FA6CE53|nr:thermonuclease family protein [Pontibacter vulgaris]